MSGDSQRWLDLAFRQGQEAIQRKEAVFQYVDPELEQLPPLQKQLLRMGAREFCKNQAAGRSTA